MKMKLCRWRSVLKVSGWFSSRGDVPAVCLSLSLFMQVLLVHAPEDLGEFYTFLKCFHSSNSLFLACSNLLSNCTYLQKNAVNDCIV